MLPYTAIRFMGSAEISAGNIHRLTAAATSSIQPWWRKVAAPVRAWKYTLPGLVFLWGACGLAEAQGPLVPPGVPAPLMKTIEQLEPRIPIDAVNTPGDAGSVYRITQPGHYYLTAPLIGEPFKRGITIIASDVTIDLMGFPVLGVSGATIGIVTEGPFSNITLRNGMVAEWPNDGINLANGGLGSGALIENVQVVHNGQRGLLPHHNAVVRGCIISENGLAGMQGADRTVLEESVAGRNGSTGFRVGSDSRIADSLAHHNPTAGFDVGARSLVNGSIAASFLITNYVGHGFVVAANSSVHESIAFANVGDGFRFTGAGGTLRDSLSTQNVTNGVYIVGSGGVVEKSMVEFCGVGIRVNGSNSSVIDNHVVRSVNNGILVASATGVIIHGNTVGSATGVNWSLAAGQRVGPIVEPNVNLVIVSGDDVGVPLGTTNPWANFTIQP